MAVWRHKKLRLALFIVDGREYSVGLVGEITPDPHPDDLGFFSSHPEISGPDIPKRQEPKKKNTQKTIKRTKAVRKKR